MDDDGVEITDWKILVNGKEPEAKQPEPAAPIKGFTPYRPAGPKVEPFEGTPEQAEAVADAIFQLRQSLKAAKMLGEWGGVVNDIENNLIARRHAAR